MDENKEYEGFHIDSVEEGESEELERHNVNDILHCEYDDEEDADEECCHISFGDILTHKMYKNYIEQLAMLTMIDPNVRDEYGYRLDDENHVIRDPDKKVQHPGVFQVMPFIVHYKDDDKSTLKADFEFGAAGVVFTSDGLRNVAVGYDDILYDLCAVNHACFLGNEEKHDGLYIPLNNEDALIDGIFMLHSIYLSAHNDKKDKYLNLRDMLDLKKCKL